MSHEAEGVVDQLEAVRRNLREPTGRSWLLDTPRRPRAGTVRIVDREARDVFRMLVQEGGALSFDPEAETCHRLRTRLSPVALQKRLFRMSRGAGRFEQRQGAGTLFLGLGFLRWYERPDSNRPRHAPLLLVPVTLGRPCATTPFRIRYTGEDLITNLSLQTRLRSDFWVELPELEAPAGDVVSPYFERVREAIARHPRWKVLEGDVTLGCYSFGPSLMARDLDPVLWPDRSALENHALVSGLLRTGFDEDDVPGDVDRIPDGTVAVHVLDADSSQALAIEDVRQGRSLVVLGPAGTGKSQTIANVVAGAVRDRKTVLFVAERTAALEVVKRRLDRVGLGGLCLEVHGTGVRTRSVLDGLGRTLARRPPEPRPPEDFLHRLREVEDVLNGHALRMHHPHSRSGLTAYEVLGWLVRLRSRGVRSPDLTLAEARTWDRAFLSNATDHVARLARHVDRMGTPALHPWRGVDVALLPERVPGDALARAAALHDDLSNWVRRVRRLSGLLGVRCRGFGDVPYLVRLARQVLEWPASNSSSLTPYMSAALARIRDPAGLEALQRDVAAGLEPMRECVDALIRDMAIDPEAVFGEPDLESVRLRELALRIRDWLAHPEKAREWATFRLWSEEARELGLTEVTEPLAGGRLAPDAAVDAFHFAYLEELTRQLFEELPELADFRGAEHEALQEEFRDLDLRQLDLARDIVRREHHAGMPVQGGAGEIGILRREMAGGDPLPLRQLLRQAGHAVRAIKPAFLMSPISVARYLTPGMLDFDLVVMDGSSEIAVSAALGPILRGRQLMVVGDDATEEPGSILELCRARGMPVRTLAYPYGGPVQPPRPTAPGRDSVFEAEVARSLRNHGLLVDLHLGQGAFAVDLVVRDPDGPRDPILGIVCDGTSYRAAGSVRDRDRLVSRVLEERGWTLHRIWIMDWFRDPEAALGRTLEAVECARVARRPAEPQPKQIEPPAPQAPVDPDTPVAADPDVDAVLEGEPYLEAAFRVRLECAPHEAPRRELIAIVSRIVEVEGPVHMDEVGRRLAAVWQAEQAGSRIQEAARWALQQAEAEGMIERDGRFVWSTKGINLRPRSRRDVSSSTLRQPRMIPPLEMRMGLRRIVEGHVGIVPTEASTLLSTVLGFDQLSPELKEAFHRQIRGMVEQDELRLRDGKLYVA